MPPNCWVPVLLHSPALTWFLHGGAGSTPTMWGAASWEALLHGQNKASSGSVQRRRHLRIFPSPNLQTQRPTKHPPTSSPKARVCWEDGGAPGSVMTSVFVEEPPWRSYSTFRDLVGGEWVFHQDTKGKGRCLHFLGLYCFKGHSMAISHNSGGMESEFLASCS